MKVGLWWRGQRGREARVTVLVLSVTMEYLCQVLMQHKARPQMLADARAMTLDFQASSRETDKFWSLQITQCLAFGNTRK